MADKNKGETIRDANPHDLRDHFEFAHAIAVAIGSNCPTAEWRSWEDVPENVKKTMMDEVLMSNLIRIRRAMTFTLSSMTTPTIAATASAEMDYRPSHRHRHRRLLRWRCLLAPDVLTGTPVLRTRCHHRDPQPMPQVHDQVYNPNSLLHSHVTEFWFWEIEEKHPGPCRQLKMAKVTRVTNGRIPIGYNDALAHDIGHVVRTFCPMQWKSWKTMPKQTKNTIRNQLSVRHGRGHVCVPQSAFLERYKQWKSDLHQCFQQFDDPHVALEEGCPKELEDRQDSWVWLCDHFQEPGYVNKTKASKINREKKTLLHRSGSGPFSYRMEDGSKFLEIDVFADVYVRPRNELTKSLHPSVPLEYIFLVFLHHRPRNPSTPSKHNSQARRPPTPSPTSSNMLI
ncbi:hypothetical protein D8674_033715 [Pyrus ussuriensis x Pyrus communis]|uniref:Uncharacterized protein n=1 Tax=Pyrus ussuriensis x Pyrus communis TaxID=2448454 RepID=A0A5N5HTQ4_9ROSA|nr:hypothetical protein D8674_033715 [Pyrus ussuriensis x Pyrus communis]